MKRAFGRTGCEVAAFGQGTWNLEQGDRAEAVKAIQTGLDLGMTHIDTAEMYGSGKAEEILGEALEDRRDKAFLVSKVLPENASRQGTVEACERSLKRLATDRLDCYLLHWESEHPLEDTIAAFEELVASGKILSWGVSNFDEERLADAVRIAGKGRVACNQVLYHLEERTIEHRVIPFCEENEIAVVGYSPFGKRKFPPSSEAGTKLMEIASDCEATPAQVALAFLVRRPSLFAIPKATTIKHVRENAATRKVDLGPAAIARIERAFPVGPSRAGVATL